MIKHKQASINSSAIQAPGKVEHITAHEGIRQDVPVNNLNSVKDMTNLVLSHDVTLRLREPLIAADEVTAHEPNELPTFVKYLTNNVFLYIYTGEFDETSGYAFITKLEIYKRKIKEREPTSQFSIKYIEVTGHDEYIYPDSKHASSIIDFTDNALNETLAIHKDAKFEVIDNQLQINGISLKIRKNNSDLFSGNSGHPLYRDTQFNVNQLSTLELDQGLKVFITFYRSSAKGSVFYFEVRVPEVTSLTGNVNDATNVDFNLALQNPYAIADLYKYGTNAVSQILAYSPIINENAPKEEGIEYIGKTKVDFSLLEAIFSVSILNDGGNYHVVIAVKQNFSFIDLKNAWGQNIGKNLEGIDISNLEDNTIRYIEVKVNGNSLTKYANLPIICRAGDILFNENIDKTLNEDINISLVFHAHKYNYVTKSSSEIDLTTNHLQIYLYDNSWNRDTHYKTIFRSTQKYPLLDFTKLFKRMVIENEKVYIRPIGLEEYGLYLYYDAGSDNFRIKNYSLLDSTEYQLFHRYAYKFLKYPEPNDTIIYPYKTYKDIEFWDTMSLYISQKEDAEIKDYKKLNYHNVSYAIDITKPFIYFGIYYYDSGTVRQIDTILQKPVETIFSPYITENTNISTQIISSVPDNYLEPTILKAYTLSSSDTNIFCNWEVSSRNKEDWRTLDEFISKNKGKLPFYNITVPDTTGESKESLDDVSNYTLTKTVVPFNVTSGEDLLENRPDVQPLQNTALTNKFKFNVYYYKDTGELSKLDHILNFFPVYSSAVIDLNSLGVGMSLYHPILSYITNNTYSTNNGKITLAAALHPYLSKNIGQDLFSYYADNATVYDIQVDVSLDSIAKTPKVDTHMSFPNAKLKINKLNNYLCDYAIFYTEQTHEGITTQSPISLDLNTFYPEVKDTLSIRIRFTITYKDKDDNGTLYNTTRTFDIIYNKYPNIEQPILPKEAYDTELFTKIKQNLSIPLHICDKPLTLKVTEQHLKMICSKGTASVSHDLFDSNSAQAPDFYTKLQKDEDIVFNDHPINIEEDDILLLGYAVLCSPCFCYYDAAYAKNATLLSQGTLEHEPYALRVHAMRDEFHHNETLAYYGSGYIHRNYRNADTDGAMWCSNDLDFTSGKIFIIIGWLTEVASVAKTFWTNRAKNPDAFNITDLLTAFKNNRRSEHCDPHNLGATSLWLPVCGAGGDQDKRTGLTGWIEAGTRIVDGKPAWQRAVEQIKACKSGPVNDMSDQLFYDKVRNAVKDKNGAWNFYKRIYMWGYNIANNIHGSLNNDAYWNLNINPQKEYTLEYTLTGEIINHSSHSQVGYFSIFNNNTANIKAILDKTCLKLLPNSEQSKQASIIFNNTEIISDVSAKILNIEMADIPYSGQLVAKDNFSSDIPNFVIPSGTSNIQIRFSLKFEHLPDILPELKAYKIMKVLASVFTPNIILMTSSNNLNIQHINYSTSNPDVWDTINNGTKDADPRLTNNYNADITTNSYSNTPIYLPTDIRRESPYKDALLDIKKNNHGPSNYWLDPALGKTLTSNAILLSSKEYIFDSSTKNLVLLNPDEQPGILEPNTYGEIPTSKYLQYRFFVWGVANYENSLFYSKTGSYEFPVLNTIEFTGDVTQVIEWRNYILVFTTKCIYLLSYDPNTDTYNSKLIHQNEGVPREYARTIKTILNGIIFRGYSGQVYKLIPNMYSSSDNVLNIRLLSEGIEHSLENDLYGNTDKDRFTSFAFSDSETYKLFIVKPKPEHESGIPVDATWCLTYNYEKDTWTKQHYPVYATNIVEVEGIPYMITDTNKHYEFYKTDLWLEDDVDNPYKRNIRYGDYLRNTKDEITYESTCIPIPFYIDFGQKASKYNIMKSYLEARFMFQTQHEKDYFPFNVEVYTDGIKRILKRDANSYSSFTKSSNKDILSLSRNQNLYSINTDSAKDTMRQFIIKYTGHGRTINFVVSGESNTPFKFYSIDSLNRDIPKK